jgi:hypothetical protein
MKRSPLKRKPLKKTKTERQQLLIDCDALFRQIILKERPNTCQCGCGKTKALQVSHILPKGTYPRLRYCKSNVLLLAFPCHPERWHKDPAWAYEVSVNILGKDYRDKLLVYEKIFPKLTNSQLTLYKVIFGRELELLEEKRRV